MMHLDGKRVLLIAPCFFGYEQEIRAEIGRRGARVDWLPDRPFDTPMMKALTKFGPRWIMPFADRFYEGMLSDLGATRYDIVLVINGQTISSTMLSGIRARFPEARLVLYMWDSMDNRRSVIDNLPLFDTAFSFDPASAREYGMHLRPLFFSKGFEQASGEEYDYHLSFVGTAHTDRYDVITRLRAGLPPEVRGYWYLYLQAPWVYHAYRLTRPDMRSARREEFNFTPLDKATLQTVFARSRAIVDIEHPLQRGLTMRTFETMGAHKKLITTNTNVRDYDFFNDANICVIDRARPRIPEDFLASRFLPLPADIYHRYSLEGWLDEVLSIDQNSQTSSLQREEST